MGKTRGRISLPVKFFQCFLLIITIFIVAQLGSSETVEYYQIEFLHDKLSVNLKDSALGPILSVIGEKTGIEFFLNKDEYDRTVSVSFQSLPVDRALKRVLSGISHACFFNADGQIQKVIIVGEGKGSVAVSKFQAGQAALESIRMEIEPARKTKMKILPSEKSMVISPPGDEVMEILASSEEMVIVPAGKEIMEIQPAVEDMDIGPGKPWM